MGQRCNLAVIRGGVTTLYYDHWAANRLDVELLWGPEAATAFAAQHPPIGFDSLLDEVWAEGGAVIDHDRQVLLWFGGEDTLYELPRRRGILAMMRAVWVGWTVRWAAGHMVEIAEALGVERARVLVASDGDGRALVVDEDDADTIVSVIRGGAVHMVAAYGADTGLLSGSGQLKGLLRRVVAGPLTWRDTEFPTAGLHLDVDRKQLGFWWAAPSCEARARMQAAWPGWTCVDWGDDIDAQLAVPGVDVIGLSSWDPAATQRALIDGFRRRCHHAGGNPARDSIAAMRAAGRVTGEVELNPWTDVAGGSVGSVEGKLAILDGLSSRVPLP